MTRASPLLRVVLVTLILAALTAFLPGWKQEPTGQGLYAGVRVGLVFDVGARGDKSFNGPAYEGIPRAPRELGATTEILEPSGAEDREAAMRLFAPRRFDLVIGVG